MTLDELKSNIKWWESKRWIYNALVGLSGAFALWDMLSQVTYYWTFSDTLGIIIWGIGANILYSLGILVKLFDWYYFKNKLGVEGYRMIFWILGTIFSCLYTFSSVFIYFIGSVF
ncbi:hypothetical protein [Leeuwenhoekiella nanhaiensis]|uniref:Uncharacterized protein n=1 Tax=Leeuwenhoekiella nanhaiensis TaxID=1655491 RepID=A0A2G1VUQ0_9FLAO|nr:hypothetical protein [Leeuwenhoekiella nanhaiensis]PHQ30179.1 hypothetical protein CJ305_04240 [Leeuwenhoekiella nanhaiensis]